MRLVHFLFLFASLVGGSAACSTTKFNSTYDAYPDCAASCLACQDSTYSQNFANNCDYVSGACCTSKYHNVIAETWSCVSSNCGDKVSEEAFDTFVKHCKNKNHALKEEDVPQGYELSDSGGKSKKPVLSTGQIIGIAIGGTTCIATIIGLILRWRHYRRKKKNPTAGSSDSNNMQLIHQPQPMALGMVANAFGDNGDVSMTYTRNTSTTSLTHGRMVTKETYEVRRIRGEMMMGTGRIIEEVD